MARQVNTGGNYKIIGQDITIGGMNADPWAYSDSGAFPFRSVAYSYVPSLFDGIEAVRQHNNGVFPTSDYTALWYDTDNWGSDPVFGIRVLYSGTTFNLQYNFRIYNSPDYVWADNLWYNNSWDDGYTGADPSNITQEDRWRQGIYIAYMTDGISFMPTANSAKYVVVYAHKSPVTGYTGAPGITSFAMATGYPGDRWYVDSGPCYYESSGGVMLASQVPGVLCILQSALAMKIETFTDDTATPGGGHGNNYGYYSLPVGVPGLPAISIMDTGMAQMWHASPSQCNDLADYLWSDDFIENIKKVNADPLANIIQFGVVPIDVSVLNGTLKEVKVGNVATGVNMYPLTHQYIQLELGSINPEEYWTSFMDYEPNSRASIFIPFCGVFDIPLNELYGKTVSLTYNIDLLSGDFVAFLHMRDGALNSVLYHKTGNLMLSFPMSGANYSNLYKTVAAGISGVAMGAATGNPGVIASSLGNLAGSVISGGSSMEISRTGNFSGASNALGCFDAYMILTQATQQFPPGYERYVGYPCYNTYKLGDLSGFTKVEQVIDNTVAATDREKEEIERLLKEGVYL